MIILDIGSGNTLDSKKTIRDTIDSLEGFDAILKAQLFTSAPPNKPLSHELFTYAYEYAAKKGLQTTASVFDKESLDFLRQFDVPFIKIAARPMLYGLVDGQSDRFIISVPPGYEEIPNDCFGYLRCVSKYPALNVDYLTGFSVEQLEQGISDHTDNLELYYTFEPEIYEKHYVMQHNDTNPDAGSFALTPEDLEYL